MGSTEGAVVPELLAVHEVSPVTRRVIPSNFLAAVVFTSSPRVMLSFREGRSRGLGVRVPERL